MYKFSNVGRTTSTETQTNEIQKFKENNKITIHSIELGFLGRSYSKMNSIYKKMINKVSILEQISEMESSQIIFQIYILCHKICQIFIMI